LLVVCLLGLCPPGQAVTGQSSEFKLKILFVFKFLKFTVWPGNRNKGKIVVGVIGETPLAAGVAEVPNAKVGDRPVFINVIPKWSNSRNEAQTKLLAECHALYICASARAHTKQIMAQLRGKSVLTIGEDSQFLEEGGVFNFFIDMKKVRFDANQRNAKASKVKISSKLLHLSRRVAK
jgi:hypothetical protein